MLFAASVACVSLGVLGVVTKSYTSIELLFTKPQMAVITFLGILLHICFAYKKGNNSRGWKTEGS